MRFGERIVVEDGDVTSKDWSWIKQVLRTPDVLALRTRDGLFRNTYLFVPSSAPEHAPLDALVSERVARK